MLLITNEDIQGMLKRNDLDLAEVNRRIERTYQDLGHGRAVYSPKHQISAPLPSQFHRDGFLDETFKVGTLQGLVESSGYFALRMKLDIQYRLATTHEKYCIEPGMFCGLVLLVDLRNAEPIALMNDGLIQHLRVGATDAVAADYMARRDAEVLGIYGSGGMARSHAQTIACVRKLRKIKVYSPTRDHRETFAAEMEEELGIEVRAVETPEELPLDCDIIAECTDAIIPVLTDRCVMSGVHITGSGGHFTPGAMDRLDAVVLHQAVSGSTVFNYTTGPQGAEMGGGMRFRGGKIGANGDVEPSVHIPDDERARHPGVRGTLAEMVTGVFPGREGEREANYFFNDCGTGIQFATIAGQVYETARALGDVHEIPTDLLTQTIRD
ncbi:MAG: Ornithine cyclodeaminase [Chloroflexi bacterium]|nr:Ornithine cyclodeaminase [Chloroflexota bacterium]